MPAGKDDPAYEAATPVAPEMLDAAVAASAAEWRLLNAVAAVVATLGAAVAAAEAFPNVVH